MYCPHCAAAAEASTKFCKSCGLKLTEHLRLLAEQHGAEAGSVPEWLREKRMQTGIIVLLVSLLNVLFFFLVFGLTALNAASAAFRASGTIMLIVFLLTTLLTAGIGIGNLIAAGFFRNFRERQLRIELALLEQRRKKLASPPAARPTNALPQPDLHAAVPGITEHTTRELDPVAVNNRTISGE